MIALRVLKRKHWFALLALLLVSAHVLWDYYHGGVAVHYPLADDSLPGISNWWGLLTIPTLSLWVLWLVDRRTASTANAERAASQASKNFLGGLLFGLVAALLWEIDAAHILQYFILLPFVLALFIPVHRAEHLLGFVLGMAYTFGGVLPILIGTVLLLISGIIHLLIHQGLPWVWAKIS